MRKPAAGECDHHAQCDEGFEQPDNGRHGGLHRVVQWLSPGTIVTLSHIHIGDANTAGNVVINTAIGSGEVTFPNGSGSLVKNGVTVTPVDLANQIINNPAGFYFNSHTALNPGGVVRGQLVLKP